MLYRHLYNEENAEHVFWIGVPGLLSLSVITYTLALTVIGKGVGVTECTLAFFILLDSYYSIFILNIDDLCI